MDKVELNAEGPGDIQSGMSARVISREPAVGPLFKDLYAGLLDVEDPTAWGPLLAGQTRSLLAHTTDIQTLAQFQSLHRVPTKHGTPYHHKTYLTTVEQLKA